MQSIHDFADTFWVHALVIPVVTIALVVWFVLIVIRWARSLADEQARLFNRPAPKRLWIGALAPQPIDENPEAAKAYNSFYNRTLVRVLIKSAGIWALLVLLSWL